MQLVEMQLPHLEHIPAGDVEQQPCRAEPRIVRDLFRGAEAARLPALRRGVGQELRDTEIEHSIVLEGARITDLASRIEDSLIGRNVTIRRVPVRPTAYRFMLGDNSEVGIRW